MARLLIVYATTEGQTAKIAEHAAETLRGFGHEARACPAHGIDDADVAAADGLIVGGSIHVGKHQRELESFVARHGAHLAERPSAFFSVSLAAASRNPAERDAALRIAESFVRNAGWRPAMIATFAGALKYTRYGWLKRMMMRRIAAKEGGDTDTSRDHEYTDWDEVSRFVETFSRELHGSGGGAPAD